MGLLQDIFSGGSSAPSVDTSYIDKMLATRNQQIQGFAGSLASARASYLNSINSYQQKAFDLAQQNAAAQTGAAGGSLNGGAYASELARAAVPMLGQAATNVYQGDLQGAEAVNNAYAGEFAPALSAYGQANTLNTELAAQRQQQYGQAMGGLIGAGISYGTGNYGLNSAMGGGPSPFGQLGTMLAQYAMRARNFGGNNNSQPPSAPTGLTVQ